MNKDDVSDNFYRNSESEISCQKKTRHSGRASITNQLTSHPMNLTTRLKPYTPQKPLHKLQMNIPRKRANCGNLCPHGFYGAIVGIHNGTDSCNRTKLFDSSSF